MKSKKAQIKMFETIAILVVFFILLLFGFIFYTKVIKGTYQEEQEEAFTLNAIELSEKIQFLPEISCTRNNIAEKGCIDLLKLKAATKIVNENRLDYFDSFGYSKVYLQEVYPNENEWILYDFEKNIDSGKISTPFPISIYDPLEDESRFGVLYIDIYR